MALFGVDFQNEQLHGFWEKIGSLPQPHQPPYDIESIEPVDVPRYESGLEKPNHRRQSGGNAAPRLTPKPTHPELDLGEGRILVLDGDMAPDDWPVFSNN